MKSASFLSSLLGGLTLLAAPAALADLTTSKPLFESRVASARTASSPGGATVLRQEIITALDAFIVDGWVDAQESSYLSTKVSSTSFLTGLESAAKKYLFDFHELNDAEDYEAPLSLAPVAATPAQLFGASGPLASSSRIKEGSIPAGAGVANQVTLTNVYTWVFGSSYDRQTYFEPVNVEELIARLKARTYSGTPSTAEVNGALAWLAQIYNTGNRIYVADWRSEGRGGPGESAGFVVAVVGANREFVRMLEVLTWAE
ncbi:hypothetical protein [Cystobacter ferrugineus]|uniref:Uncharacterized protein n=1 Tax=Cystobacter ferrugineus TaxID=83449 RepID=A0A1L9BAS0_9BACT|nr:hypothetical protein [Cystobacter ferrugineus]OJH39366.1 hypothetical protein BON30_17805 [Cystobacter ferrugineus]